MRLLFCRFGLLALAAAWLVPAGRCAADSEIFTQQPTVAASQVPKAEHGERSADASAAQERAKQDERKAAAAPKPQWIWGAKDAGADDRYWFRKEFEAGPAREARLVASCDNRLVVFLNGKRIVQGDTWQQPVRVDIRRQDLKEGTNEIVVEAANGGGPAGLVLRLTWTGRDGHDRHVVTDKTWTAAKTREAKESQPVAVLGELGVQPWGNVFAAAVPALASAPQGVFEVLPGFQVELLYTVPKETQGSWVALTFDDKGRIIASDQNDKGLYRITPPPIGSDQPTKVERLDAKITAAQGLLHAFGSLYVSVNGGPGSGFYRLRDTDGDDNYDSVEKLKDFAGGGEHGPHALRLAPDGQSIYVMAGNHTDPPKDLDGSRLPSNWGEDLLLPRQWDARGHARGRLAPGGWTAQTDPDGKTWTITSNGYRNAYDMAFNADGELFAYDADMEWDMGTPWYRPTRVVHATSGSEFGWRSGTGKWPTYYLDSLPAVVDLGPGSPVGVEFGYGAKFPAKYQQALYLLDWTFGTIYAVHLEPDGSSYRGEVEEFLSRTPLPLTDAAVGPDGALYFAVGGRGTQSELFRVTYVGDEATEPATTQTEKGEELRVLRRQLEEWHEPGEVNLGVLFSTIWRNLNHEDRFIGYAARVALEHRPVKQWRSVAFQEKDPSRVIQAAVALARQGEPSDQPPLLDALDRLDFASLEEQQKLGLLRAYSLAFIRLGRPDPVTVGRIAQRLDEHYPSKSDRLNRELAQVLVYLNSPTVISKTLALMDGESTGDTTFDLTELLSRNTGYGGPIAEMLANHPDLDKVHYALVLRNMQYGWTLDERRRYFEHLNALREKSGGASYTGFIDNIRKEALENTSAAEREALASSVVFKPPKPEDLPKPHGPKRDWTTADLVQLTEGELSGRNYENGKRAYAAARCVVCHRFAGDGGATGPDLTNAAGRFSRRDLAEALIEPDKVISDQYRASIVTTVQGKVISGRIISEQDGTLTVMTDPQDASVLVEVDRQSVDEVIPSKTSLMPKDLLDPLGEEEVLDLVAFLLSRGNPSDPMFAK